MPPDGRPPFRADHIGSLLRPAALRQAFRRRSAGAVDERGRASDSTAPYVAGKVSRREPITLDEFRFVSGITEATPKITMPAPSTMHFYRYTQDGEAGVYGDPAEFFADLGKVYQAEIADLARAGCRYVQLDEVALAILCDPAARAKVQSGGEDPDRLVDLYVSAINQAAKNAPPQVTVGVHVCRGNYKGM